MGKRNGNGHSWEATASPTVLVIDDDEALRRMLRLSMTSVGISVATAEDGLAGLEQLADNNYDVIILDLQMPRMDGRAFYREMRARGCEAQVVILSAYGADSAQRELGAVAAIAKPFDPEVLTDTVRIVAERARKAS